jgi:hypothetical protein
MSIPLPRRAAFAAAAASVLPVTPVLTGNGQPDEVLIACCHEAIAFHDAYKRELSDLDDRRAFNRPVDYDNPALDAEVAAAYAKGDRAYALLEQAADTPAVTMAGLRAEAHSTMKLIKFDGDRLPRGPDSRLHWGLANDLLRGVASRPRATE